MRESALRFFADWNCAEAACAPGVAGLKRLRFGFVALGLCFVPLCGGVAQEREPETFVLNGGRMITGTIIDANRNTVAIRNPTGIAQIVRSDDIQTVYIPAPDSNLRPFFGSFVAWKNGIYELNINFQLVKIENGAPQGEPVPVDFSERASHALASPAAGSTSPEDIVAPAAKPAKIEPGIVAPTSSEIPILDVKSLPTVESEPYIAFGLTLSKPVERPLYVAYSTLDGSARAAVDYKAERDVLVIPAGAQTAELRISLIDDSLAEKEETFTLTIMVAPTSAHVRQSRIETVIADND